MVKSFFLLFIFSFLFLFKTCITFAIENPLTLPNNKFGVHILFTSELEKARGLVNSSGGDWGYVTIPIQALDRDLEKWQKFMDDCGMLHLIPIVRIATENHYFDTSFWRKPDVADVLDFANFLNSLNWPVKNRYVIIFNEVNRGDEWGGNPNPGEYAQILNYAAGIFKSLSPDFFIISAGLDNAAENSNISLNQYNFMRLMNDEVSGVFSQIDGLGSHSYPNPSFSVPPWITTNKNISSFKFEKHLAYELSSKNLPIFITETGWSRKKLSESLIGQYFRYAFENIWSDKSIVAVTPFLLQAGGEPFLQFSLLDEGKYNEVGASFQKIIKTKGNPTVNQKSSSYFSKNIGSIPLKTFSNKIQYEASLVQRAKTITPFLKWLLKISD